MPIAGTVLRQLIPVGAGAAAGAAGAGVAGLLGGGNGNGKARGIRVVASYNPQTGEFMILGAAPRKRRRGFRMPRVAADALRAQSELTRDISKVVILGAIADARGK